MKPQTQKIVLVVLFLILTSFGIYHFSKKMKRKGFDKEKAKPLFPLKKGMNNKYIEAMQKGLNKQFSTGLRETGEYEDRTLEAVVTHVDTSFVSSTYKPSRDGILIDQFISMQFDKLV